MNIIVIGEHCEDIFIYGNVNRLCPEAPVPIFIPKKTVRNSGMSGNVVNNLESISDFKRIHLIRQNCIITKTRYVDLKTNHMFMRVDEGDENVNPYNMNFDLSSYEIVVVSDYNKGFLTNEHLKQIGTTCKGLSIIDTKRKLTQDIIDLFTFIKVNKDEYQQNKDIIDINKEKVIITLGKDGVLYNDKHYSSLNPMDTIDVSGAGDTFTASFTFKYYQTKDIDQSIMFANEMSGLVVTKRGVVTPFTH